MYYDHSTFRSPNESNSQEIRTDLQGKHNLEKWHASLEPLALPPAAAPRQETKATASHYDPDNLFIGGAWGLLSGYVTNAFAAPISTTCRILMWRGVLSSNRIANLMTSEKYFFPTVVSCRMAKNVLLAGFIFDQTERKTAEIFNFNKTNSALTGLAVVSLFFRLSTDLRHTAIGTSFAIGGFLVGTKLASIIDKYKAINRSRIQQRRSNYRVYELKTT